jgi:hypothetical protein
MGGRIKLKMGKYDLVGCFGKRPTMRRIDAHSGVIPDPPDMLKKHAAALEAELLASVEAR